MTLEPRPSKVERELAKGHRWWSAYDHETPEQQTRALVEACEYWHACWEIAQAELERLRSDFEIATDNA